MKVLACYLAILFGVVGGISAHTELPPSIQGLPWKKAAQDLSKDPFFQADIKGVMATLPAEGRAALSKCIGRMIKGEGAAPTGTPADAILAKELRRKARAKLSDPDAAVLDALADADLLTLAGGGGRGDGEAKKLPERVQILLDSDPASGLNARDSNVLKLGKPVTRFKIVPGLADLSMVSFEQENGENRFLRHYLAKMEVDRRPPAADELFEADATYKVIHLEKGKVKIQSKNYPSRYICVNDAGVFVLEEITDESKAVFRFTPK